MHNSVGMAVGGGLQNLIREFFDCLNRQVAIDCPHVLLEVVLAVFENEVQVVFLVNDLLKTKWHKNGK